MMRLNTQSVAVAPVPFPAMESESVWVRFDSCPIQYISLLIHCQTYDMDNQVQTAKLVQVVELVQAVDWLVAVYQLKTGYGLPVFQIGQLSCHSGHVQESGL